MRRKPEHSKLYRTLRVVFYRKRFVLVISVAVLLAMGVCLRYSLRHMERPPRPAQPRMWCEIVASDTLVAVTIPASSTAFEYRGEWYGHEYENAKTLAKAMGLHLKVLLVQSEQALVDSLYTGAADVAIWPMSYSVVDNHWFLLPTGPRWEDSQCIASLYKLDLEAYQDSTLTDSMLLALPKYRLSVVKDSRQWLTLSDDSVRAHFDLRPFVIDTIAHDSLTVEQVTDSMIERKTDAVMLRCNVARLMHDYYAGLMVSDTIPFSNDSVAWMVARGADTLKYMLDSLTNVLIAPGTPHYLVMPNSQLRAQRQARMRKAHHFKMSEGGVSVYDNIFKAVGKKYDLDWRLLAGIGYIESNFNHAVVSNRGPLGLMQLMPQTAEIYGYTNEEVLDPEINVDIAAQLLSRLRDIIQKKVPEINNDDLLCFMLASYNAGYGHVNDAINMAIELGYRPYVWEDHVEHCLRLKYEPKYYKMEVVKQGKFNGAFTINYVNEVMAAYHTFRDQTE